MRAFLPFSSLQALPVAASRRSMPSLKYASRGMGRRGERLTVPVPSFFAASRSAGPRSILSNTPGITAVSACGSSVILIMACRRSEQTAHVLYSPLGWAEISHPFHPLRGRRFEVLKQRRIAGVDTLILRELERGTLSIPREWTDWADPSPYDSLTLPPHRLAADCLFELVALLDAVTASSPSALGKDPQKRIDK